MKKIHCLFLVFVGVCAGCTDDDLMPESFYDALPMSTRSIPVPTLNWENADWMPTPPGQSRIPSPWVGAGSLASTYGMDVVNDRMASDGWTLLYNTFDANAPGQLVNPYFVLYNKYRGTMRIFLYVTTSFVTTSSYLQDGLSVVYNGQTTMLNFLGSGLIDLDKRVKNYQQLQPAPSDGSSPLASNRWYMMEYELAYDPFLGVVRWDRIQLNWSLNYCNVTQFSFEGNIEGTLHAIMGSSETTNPIKDLGQNVGKGVFAGIGMSMLENNTINSATGENRLGLKPAVFKSLTSGLSKGLSGVFSDLPGTAVRLLSALFGGSRDSQPVNYKLDATIKLQGTGISSGSFPSSPVSFWVPGTNFIVREGVEIVGYIPLYNKLLGVINLKEKPTYKVFLDQIVYVTERDGIYEPVYTEEYVYASAIPDFTEYVQINPEVKRIADVEIVKQEVLFIPNRAYGGIEPDYDFENISVARTNYGYEVPAGLPDWALRLTVKVTPKDGTPPSTIIKTFLLKQDIVVSQEERYIY